MQATNSVDRVIGHTTVCGTFGLPLGIQFLRHEQQLCSSVEISTVCLDGAYLSDPLGICDAETGYETMVFLEGCTFFSLFTQSYLDRDAASAGHADVLRRILAGTLPLAIPLTHYHARG